MRFLRHLYPRCCWVGATRDERTRRTPTYLREVAGGACDMCGHCPLPPLPLPAHISSSPPPLPASSHATDPLVRQCRRRSCRPRQRQRWRDAARPAAVHFRPSALVMSLVLLEDVGDGPGGCCPWQARRCGLWPWVSRCATAASVLGLRRGEVRLLVGLEQGMGGRRRLPCFWSELGGGAGAATPGHRSVGVVARALMPFVRHSVRQQQGRGRLAIRILSAILPTGPFALLAGACLARGAALPLHVRLPGRVQWARWARWWLGTP